MKKQKNIVKRIVLSSLNMVAGKEKEYSIVIDHNVVMQWIGIGWIELREATKEDKENYPLVVD